MLEKIIKKYYKDNPYKGYHELSKIFGIPAIEIINMLFKDKIVLIKDCEDTGSVFWFYPRKNIKIKYSFQDNVGVWEKEIYKNNLLRVVSDYSGGVIRLKYHNGRLIKKEYNDGYWIKFKYYPNTNDLDYEYTSDGFNLAW